MAGKGNPKTGGRNKGTPNRISGLLKTAIIEAAEQAGGDEGLVGYLAEQAKDNPAGFMALLVKVLPLQEAEETRRRDSEGMMDLNLISFP
jgi:hypothetical protein